MWALELIREARSGGSLSFCIDSASDEILPFRCVALRALVAFPTNYALLWLLFAFIVLIILQGVFDRAILSVVLSLHHSIINLLFLPFYCLRNFAVLIITIIQADLNSATCIFVSNIFIPFDVFILVPLHPSWQHGILSLEWLTQPQFAGIRNWPVTFYSIGKFFSGFQNLNSSSFSLQHVFSRKAMLKISNRKVLAKITLSPRRFYLSLWEEISLP